MRMDQAVGGQAMAQAERQLLPAVPDLAARLRAGETLAGGWAELEPVRHNLGYPVGDVLLCHMRDALWVPRTGMLYDAAGRPVASCLMAAGGRILPLPRGRRMTLESGAVFAGFGAGRNYGHFLLDGLAGLAALDDLGLLRRFPAVSGSLLGWQRQATSIAGLPVQEVAAAQVRLGEVIFVTAMNHYLHRCDGLLAPLAARMGGRGTSAEAVVYLSRRRFAGRILLQEPALEAALQARGARVLRPETMLVADQIAAMRDVRVVIAPSGAALANLIFAPKGATLIEIRPDSVREPWVDLICARMGLRHRVVAAPMVAPEKVPLSAWLRQLPRRVTGRYHQVMQADISAVLAELDAL